MKHACRLFQVELAILCPTACSCCFHSNHMRWFLAFWSTMPLCTQDRMDKKMSRLFAATLRIHYDSSLPPNIARQQLDLKNQNAQQVRGATVPYHSELFHAYKRHLTLLFFKVDIHTQTHMLSLSHTSERSCSALERALPTFQHHL